MFIIATNTEKQDQMTAPFRYRHTQKVGILNSCCITFIILYYLLQLLLIAIGSLFVGYFYFDKSVVIVVTTLHIVPC